MTYNYQHEAEKFVPLVAALALVVFWVARKLSARSHHNATKRDPMKF